MNDYSDIPVSIQVMIVKQLEEIKAIERFHIRWVSGVLECLY